MKLIMLKGVSKSGKTAVAEKIIAGLKARGYTVSSVKDIHSSAYACDEEGTDTDRHRRSGANPVTGRGVHDTAVMFNGSLDIDRILDMCGTDYVVLEGDSGANCPKIVTGRTPEEADGLIDGRTIALSGIMAEHMTEYRGLPVINGLTDAAALCDLIEEKTPERMPNFAPGRCSRCGGDCRSLLERVLRGEASAEDCILRGRGISVRIDGEELSMVPFVEDIVAGAITGVLKTLKGYRPDAEISIRIKP